MTRRDEGFSLIELLMVVAMIGILASMAVNSLWRSRAAANESSAIMSLRNLSSGQVAYSSSCGQGRFTTNLTMLGPQPATPQGFVSPELTAAAIVQKSGYTIQMAAAVGAIPGPNDCNGNPTQSGYYAWAEPMTYGTTGNRSFATNSPTFVVWQVYGALAPPEPFVPPAIPIR